VTKSLRASVTSPGGFAVRSPFRDFVHLKVLQNAKHFAKPPGVITHLKKMRIKNSIIFATLYSIVGILIGIDIVYKMNESYHLFIIVLPIAFFITSIVLWKFLINKPTLIFKNESLQSKFIFTAFLIGIISHPIS